MAPNHSVEPGQFHQGHKEIEILDRTHTATSTFICMAEIRSHKNAADLPTLPTRALPTESE